mgnify:CR=1 FL=1
MSAQPVFTGTPEQWWEQAEPVMESEAAERLLGSWYIVAESRKGGHTGSYRVARPTRAGNDQRLASLRHEVARGRKTETQTSDTVRRLIYVPQSEPEWATAQIVIADAREGSDERVAWRKSPKYWLQVFDARASVSDATMARLNPVVATITTSEQGRV